VLTWGLALGWVHLGELEGAIAATDVEAIRKRAQEDTVRWVLGVP
jgi:hypothetical protein